MSVTSYDVRISGTNSLGDQDPTPKALMRLKEGGLTIGFIKFFSVGVPMPADVQRPSGENIITEMNLSIDLLPAIVDLFRNEKPVVFFFGNGRAHVTTNAELVGEGEVS
jgi:hypothetical protein